MLMPNFGLIIQFIFVFGLIVFVHELGHFLVAKMVGVDVEEFGFGYPPRLVKLFTWKGTELTLNWIPFGGFVRLKGETDDGAPGGMLEAPKWKRFLILFAGATMNFVLGILLLIFLYNVVNPVDTSKILVVDVAPNSPAQILGLQPGDIVTRLGDDPTDSTDAMVAATKKHLGEEVTLTYTRDGEERTGLVIPRANPPEGEGAIGFVMSHPEVELNFVQSIGVAFNTFWEQVKATVSLPVNFIKGRLAPGEGRVIGVKGIYDLFSSAAEMDQANAEVSNEVLPITRLSLVSMLSIAIGITNLLPIPALDGGRILFTLPELLTGKRIPQKWENAVNTVSFLLLILLMVVVTVLDFTNPIVLP